MSARETCFLAPAAGVRRRVAALLLLVAACAPATLQARPDAQVLRWGGDAEGGAPYQSPDPDDPGRIIGFEVDIADALGRRLGRRPEFVQNQWDGLIPGLQRNNYDMVISGLEITPDRAAVVAFSRPYYVTYLRIAVRRDTDDIASFDDLAGRRVGTLKGSLAHRMLDARGDVRVSSYDGQVNCYEDLANGRLDAVLLDDIIALYNVTPMPQLEIVGAPIGRIEYGIAIRPDDRALVSDVDRALGEMIASGELRQILDDWGIWTAACAESFGDRTPPSGRSPSFERYLASRRAPTGWRTRVRQYLGYLPMLGQGAVVTVELSIVSMVVAIVLGLTLGLARLYGPAPVRWASVAFIEAVRGTPLLIQLFLIFYGLPHVGIKLSPMLAAICGMGLNYSAYEAENYRAGIQSIPRTQMEAALALGMTRWQALRHVIVPQAMRLVIPPVTNDFIALFKDSSLVSVITLVELTKAYGQLAAIHYDYLGIGLLTAAMYFLIGLPFVRLARWAERHFTPQERRPAGRG